jgi:hypothetical protein
VGSFQEEIPCNYQFFVLKFSCLFMPSIKGLMSSERTQRDVERLNEWLHICIGRSDLRIRSEPQADPSLRRHYALLCDSPDPKLFLCFFVVIEATVSPHCPSLASSSHVPRDIRDSVIEYLPMLSSYATVYSLRDLPANTEHGD